MTSRRYLPLKNDSGAWIERPDLFVLARMAVPDTEVDYVVVQIYDTVKRADNSSPLLNSFESDIEKRQIGRSLRLRIFAGQVVLEMVRIAASISKSPSAAQAITLASLNHHRASGRSSPEDLRREVKRGFSEYRNTAHLQAALVLAKPRIDEIEESRDALERFLGRARGFEYFFDTNVAHDGLPWTPWRIPKDIMPIFELDVPPLSREERRILNL